MFIFAKSVKGDSVSVLNLSPMDIIHILFNPLPNGIASVLMIIIILYWIFALIGGLGMDDLDLGIDLSQDIDIDASIDQDIQVDTGSGGGFLQALQFLNLGRVPFMIVFTVFILFLWIVTLVTSYFFDISVLGNWSAFILLPAAIASLFVTGWVTKPLAGFFHQIGYNGEKAINFFGCSGKMLSTIEGDKIGVAEFLIGENLIRLNVKSMESDKILYGESVIIARIPDEGNVYQVIKN